MSQDSLATIQPTRRGIPVEDIGKWTVYRFLNAEHHKERCGECIYRSNSELDARYVMNRADITPQNSSRRVVLFRPDGEQQAMRYWRPCSDGFVARS